MSIVLSETKLRDEVNFPGLQDSANVAGHELREVDGVFHCRDATAFSSFEASYDPLSYLKVIKIAEIRLEGLQRVQSVFPAITNYDVLELERERWLSINANARNNPTAAYKKAIDAVTAARTAIASVNNSTTLAQVRAVTPSWPS